MSNDRQSPRRWADISDSHPVFATMRRAYIDMLLGEPPNYDEFPDESTCIWYETSRQALTALGQFPEWGKSERAPDWFTQAFTVEHRGLRRNPQ